MAQSVSYSSMSALTMTSSSYVSFFWESYNIVNIAIKCDQILRYNDCVLVSMYMQAYQEDIWMGQNDSHIYYVLR